MAQRSAKTSPKKILVQRADRLGDVALILPMLHRLKQAYPSATIHVLTSTIGQAFLRSQQLIDEIHIVKFNDKGQPTEKKALIEKIKKEAYSHYISAWQTPFFAALGVLAHIPIRIGDKNNLLLSYFYTHAVDTRPNDITQHISEKNNRLLLPLQIDISQSISLKIDEEEMAKRFIDELLKKYANPSKKNIAMVLSTGGSNTPIPEATILDFMKKMEELSRYNIFLLGTYPAPQSILALQPKDGFNLIGKTSVQEMSSVLLACDYYVGPDTGPTHIASLSNKKMLLFSPTKSSFPSRWGPLSSTFKIVRKDNKCRHQATESCTQDCIQYLDGGLLYHSFFELENDLALDGPFTEKEKQIERLRASLNTVVITRSHADYDAQFKTAMYFRQKGLKIHVFLLGPLSIKEIRRLGHFMLRKNTTIILGDCPRWLIKWLQFYMTTIKQYIKPRYIPDLPLSSYVSITDYLSRCEKAFWHG